MPVTNNPRCYLSISSLARKRPIVPSEQSAFSLPTQVSFLTPIATRVPIRFKHLLFTIQSRCSWASRLPYPKVTDGSFDCELLDRMGRVEYKLQPANARSCTSDSSSFNFQF